MLSERPAELIQEIDAVGGLSYEQFTSAAGISGNLKINFVEALARLPILRNNVVLCMAESLKDMDAITGVPSGGFDLAAEVAFETGKPLIVIEKYQRRDRKGFHISNEMKGLLKDGPSIGIVEDVTSTRYSLNKAAHHPYLRGMVKKGVSGWRRGKQAPPLMKQYEIARYNRQFASKPPLEVGQPFPLDYVIEKPLPLLIKHHWQVAAWLPELNETGRWIG